MFLWLKTLYRKRAVTWPFIFYTIIWTLSSLLLILLTLMQYKEYPEYFILTFVYLVSSYTLLYKFRSSSRVSKVCFLISLLIL
ncbi:hypothetical protein EGY01_12305 [Enterococcus faecium]|uniref:Sensor histidine kinase n=1 Tax=Enterococcus faecalis TaxID=1351 RepID=A0A3N3RHN9_ENTFL|nr:hypothetical protein EGW27_12360 [Enterococcus faecium]ROY44209.1 hypothetical protein EGW70_16595 [Enterococcus faecalis]ROX84278.1 hypothetical protein EGW47_12360 [Enterococcus faecium]ROY22430.1 hypothetical protein EGW58_12315 [Enterococcus faecium]ROY37054.1 hypothetical protein EGY01_12305 [Enterococcus faecium]